MPYKVLAIKYRPKKFSEFLGQQHIISSIVNALDSDRLHQAYLFSGTRGIGKTSLARLLAKSMNCLEGTSSSPCGICANCLSTETGQTIDLIEIDAASRTKVEDMHEILDNIQYMPSQSKYKIYIIDEVHMLSKHSFNALLKTLEEPPTHIKFIFATTNPEKLPATILSRCLHFNLTPFNTSTIIEQLEKILKNENILFEATALKHIAHSAAGSMRDALTLTDQAISFGKDKILEKDVAIMLGIVSKQIIETLVENILHNNIETLLKSVQEITRSGKSVISVLDGLAEFFYYASIKQFLPNKQDNVFANGILNRVCEECQPEQLQVYYQLTIKSKKDAALAPTTQCGLGMSLLRLCAFNIENTEINKLIDNQSVSHGKEKEIKVSPGLHNIPEMIKKVKNKLQTSEDQAENGSITQTYNDLQNNNNIKNIQSLGFKMSAKDIELIKKNQD